MSQLVNAILLLALTSSPLFSTHSFGAIQNYKFGEDEFSINIPDNWKQISKSEKSQGMMGVPLTLFGPENEEETRPVILVTPLALQDQNDVFKNSGKDVGPYEETMNEWLSSKDGKLINVEKLTTKKDWNNVDEAYFLGSRYEVYDQEYRQKTAYIICKNKRVFHLKSIVLKKEEKKIQPIIDNTFESFTCPKETETKKVARS